MYDQIYATDYKERSRVELGESNYVYTYIHIDEHTDYSAHSSSRHYTDLLNILLHLLSI